jgi:tellurite resistance protein
MTTTTSSKALQIASDSTLTTRSALLVAIDVAFEAGEISQREAQELEACADEMGD